MVLNFYNIRYRKDKAAISVIRDLSLWKYNTKKKLIYNAIKNLNKGLTIFLSAIHYLLTLLIMKWNVIVVKEEQFLKIF